MLGLNCGEEMERRNIRKNFCVAFVGFFIAFAAFFLFPMKPARGTAVPTIEPGAKTEQSSSQNASAKLHVIDLFARQPLSFERNDGQTDARVKYISRGEGYTLFLTPTEAVLALRRPSTRTGETNR